MENCGDICWFAKKSSVVVVVVVVVVMETNKLLFHV